MHAPILCQLIFKLMLAISDCCGRLAVHLFQDRRASRGEGDDGESQQHAGLFSKMYRDLVMISLTVLWL